MRMPAGSAVLAAALLCAGAAAAAPAQNGPVGWRTRVATEAPAMDLENAPPLPSPQAQWVIANARPAAPTPAQPLEEPGASLSLGLPASLPDHDMARVRELARGLDHDWLNCYEFVRNHIDYAPYHGIMRGPERTLLDREGNDADQSFLLLALLRASGYAATVVYEPFAADGDGQPAMGFYAPLYGSGSEPRYTAASWLGIPETGPAASVWDRVALTLTAAGRPVGYLSDGRTPYVVTDHFWVMAMVDGQPLHLDPSFKPTLRTAGRDAAADMGYDRSSLIASAGGTVDANSVKGLSEPGLAAKLDALSAALRSSWTNENAAASQCTGSSSTAAQSDGHFFHGGVLSHIYDFLQLSDADKNWFRASATVEHGGLSSQFFLDELGARHLWISYASSCEAHPRAVLRLDDAVLATEPAGSDSAEETMTLSVEYHPASMAAGYSLARGLANVCVIPVGFGGDARGGMRTWATEELSRLRASGAPPGDARTIGRSMQEAGQQWLAQAALLARIRNQLTGRDYRCFYNIGVAGQAAAPYVDMKNSYGYSTADMAPLDGGMLFSSALEHAVLDQLNGTNAPSVSTVKILELANASGDPVYLANASNYAAIEGGLVNYSPAQKASFQGAVSAGRVVLLPKNASATLNQWTGAGYIENGPAGDDTYSTGMIIEGGMNGGFGTVSAVADSASYTVRTQPTTTFANAGVPETTHADPVSMPSGAYLDARTDLLVNCGAPLAWTRHYDSRGRHDDGGLGRGWSHGYEASVVECADPDAVFGRTSVEAVIPTAVAIAAVEDMLAEQSGLPAGEIARRWTIAALAVQWWARQLTGATVSVNLGARSLRFQRRTDGAFEPYPGVTAGLALTNGVYRLTERLGPAYEFNAAGKLASVTDRSGNVTSLAYDQAGRLAGVSNAFGASLAITWSGGRISRVTDSAGRSVSYAYSSGGCLTNVTDARGKDWAATYDPATFALLTQTDPDGNVTIRNSYNSLGQVTNQISAIGQPWTFGYAASTAAWDDDPLGNRLLQSYTDEGRALRRTDRDGAMTDYRRDGHGHVTSKMDAAGRVDRCHYDGDGNLVQSGEGTDELFRVTDFVYDHANRLVAATNALGHATAFAYDQCDRLLATAFPDGASVTNAWGAKGLLSSETVLASDGSVLRRAAFAYGANGLPLSRTVTGPGLPPAGVTETYAYSAAGLPLSVTDADGRTATFTYDEGGNLLTATDPAGNVTSRTYTDAGRLETVTDALGRVTALRWTPSGELASMLRPNGAASTNAYDAADRLASATDARGATVAFTRDAAGRVLSSATASGTARAAYDVMGLPTNSVDAAGVSTRTFYDPLYRPRYVQNALGHCRETDYDLLDRLARTADPLGKMRWTLRDPMGRATASVRPSGAVDSFGYDGLGFMTSHTNAEGRVFSMTRDALGRITSATDAAGRLLATNVYDGAGNLLSRTDGNGATVSFAHDACDRVTGKSGPGVAEAFSYDAVGNLVSAANAAAAETFAYDTMDRLASATTVIGGRAFTNAWLRDAGGLVTNIAYAPGKALAKTYDADGRLASVTDWLGHAWTFAWDGAGKPTGGASPGGAAHAFAYDAAGRLSGWSAGTLAGRAIERDAAGRRVRDTVTAGPMPRSSVDRRAVNTFDAADRLVSASVTYGVTNPPVLEVYRYDGNGAMTNAVSGGLAIFAAAYDAQGQVAALGGEAFAYDALGNRVIAGGRVWVPDHDDPLKRPLIECDENGAPLRYYLWGPGRLLGFIDAEGVLTVAHSDEQGSVVALTAPDGDVLHTAGYGPHGEDWGATGANTTPFAWLGGHGVRRLAAGGALAPLYLTRHRLYSATLNRFLSADPLGLAGGLNLYAYAEGDPLAYIDPLGLCAEGGMWYDRLSALTFEKVDVAKDFYGEHLHWGVAGTFATAIDLASGLAHLPAAIGHLGEGAGTFAGSPSWDTASGLFSDIGTAATVLSATASALPSLNGSAGVGAATKAAASKNTEIVQRAMSRAEYINVEKKQVLSRGGRPGNHYVSDAVNSTANRARQRLALPVQPQVRVTLEVPRGVFSPPSRVQPYVLPNGQVLPGGGMERIAPGNIDVPVRIINKLDY